MDMQRANRIAVQTTAEGFEAKLFRTHKHVATIASTDTAWQADPKHNKTAQREAFREWICSNAQTYGILWDPNDNRTDENRRVAKYDTDDALLQDAAALIRGDMEAFVAGCKIDGLVLMDVVGEDIQPMTTSPKGADLSKIGILDGKYANGNWAWATISVVATVGYSRGGQDVDEEDMGYVTLTCQLVSGQLRKPTAIDGSGYTQTAFRNAILKDIQIDQPKPEESKPEGWTEVDTSTEESQETMDTEEIAEEPKKTRKNGKKA